MKHHFVKRLKMLCRDFTFMVVPNSGKKIHSCRIPFIVALAILGFIIFNIYIFFGFTIQVWHISRLRRGIAIQTEMNTRLNAERSLVKPVLDKNQVIVSELTRYRQEYQEVFDTWKRVRQKGNLRFTLASRGGFRSSIKIYTYNLTSIANPKTITTSLDQLDNNLDQLKNILQKENQEQSQLLQTLQAYERHLDHTPTLWPVYAPIISPFGERFHPIFRRYIRS